VKRRPKKGPTRALVIDIRDQRFEDGRYTISSRTRDSLEYALRRAAVYTLLEDGERGLEILRRLKAGELRIQEVAEKVHAKQIASLEPEAPEAPTQVLGATIDRFLVLVKAKKAHGTLIQYRGFCWSMEEAFGVVRDEDGIVKDVPISGIEAKQGEAWLHGTKARIGRAWSPRRQAVAHAVAHQVWALAIEADEERAEKDRLPRTLTRNLFSKGRARISPPKIRKTRVVFLSRQQAGRLLWAVRGRPAAILVAAGIYGGLRAGEATHLRRDEDVDLAKARLVIQPREGEYPWRPKTDNSVRDVPMNRQLVRWIRSHIRTGYAGDTYLTRGPRFDKPINGKTRERWVIEAFEKAGIEYGRDKGQGATLHTLRHTFASWLAQKDIQLLKIAALMGDTNQEVEKTYAHLLPKDLRGAVDRLSRKGR
jgi:integrase